MDPIKRQLQNSEIDEEISKNSIMELNIRKVQVLEIKKFN
jgi:hypothetical protein